MTQTTIMKREKLRIRFDGPALDSHTIDVGILGKSLTGLGELLKHANKVVNDDKVDVRVEMKADIEANCVTMDFAVVMSFYEAIVSFVENDHVKSAKEILEWIGITGGAAFTAWKLFVWISSNREPGQKVTTKKDGDVVTICIEEGRKEIKVPIEVYNIADNPACQKAFLDLISPLQHEGITEATFQGNASEVSITQSEARTVSDAIEAGIGVSVDPQIIEGHIQIYAPTFNPEAKKWKFKWNGRVETIDISGTNIAKSVMERGNIRIGDAFRVRMEIIEKRTGTSFKQHFRVIEVLDFVPAPSITQGSLGLEYQDDSEDD